MPRFEPFVGLRYDAGSVVVADVIAPPYDVVDENERVRLAGRSPYNSILVELPAPDPERGLDRYENAAYLLGTWQQLGVLRREESAGFSVYEMRFRDEEGRERRTTGVIGALDIDRPGGGEVLPHERTTPKPKGDRLELLRACRANLSPIWGLSLAEGLSAACDRATGGRPAPLSGVDEDGVIHECWPIDDPTALAEIRALAASRPVVIADGHHRYETAGFFRDERRAETGDVEGPYDAVMAYLVELAPEQLYVQAIHRLVSGLPVDADLDRVLERWFVIEAAPDDVVSTAKAMAEAGALAVVTAGGSRLLVPTAELLERAEADLDSSRLDVVLDELGPHEVAYQHGLRNVEVAVADGRAQVGFLLRPANVDQIADTAHSGRRMPPKTTFFQPKPRTGLVFRPLDS